MVLRHRVEPVVAALQALANQDRLIFRRIHPEPSEEQLPSVDTIMDGHTWYDVEGDAEIPCGIPARLPGGYLCCLNIVGGEVLAVDVRFPLHLRDHLRHGVAIIAEQEVDHARFVAPSVDTQNRPVVDT